MVSALAAPSAAARTADVTAPGPAAPLAGTLLTADAADAPVVLIIPGSGPTDRNGNSPLGVAASSYRLLAEALAAKGVSTARIDKRGMFGSKAAIPDANKVTIGDYAADVASWTRAIKEKTGRPCVWLAGHSEGGLVALAAARNPDICGLVLIATAGRKLDAVMREQIAANPANAPIAADAGAAIDALAKGEHVDVSAMHPALAQGLFNPAVQDYLIDVFRYDPAALIAKVDRPVLIVSGLKDIQVSRQDAEMLAAAQPKARLVLVEGMSHTLKQVDGDGMAANLATYGNPDLPIDPTLVEAIAAFVRPGA
jgi:pimeloyl-ACP methyl ester carboxylesterase